MKLEFSRQIFEKSANIKFYRNLSSGRWIVPCGQTDRRTDKYDETDSRSLLFCESA